MPESPEPQQKNQLNPKPETLIQVLHVDDDDDFLVCSKRILEMLGPFQIEDTLSVNEALQKLEQKSYDVIVADYQMPDRTGLDFLKELRKKGNDVPFILFTGKGREEVAIEALNLGADRYFNKSGKPETVYGELSHGIITAAKAKYAEKTLQESEEKYRKQFEEALDSLILVDVETGIIVDCNRAATNLIGRTKAELIGKPQRILHPPTEYEGKFTRTYNQHLNKKEGRVLKSQVITKAGEIRDVAIKANIFEAKGKKILRGIFRDITEQKKTEEKLRRERETLELVTANINAGLSVIAKDYTILWANNFLKTVCGGEVKGKKCYLVYNDHGKICPGCGVKEVFETGKSCVIHEQLVPGHGDKRTWVEITANPIRDKDGNIDAALELSVFLDERKKLENQLREAKERYHALFSKAPLGILIVDSTGTAVEFNEEAHSQLGYSREEFAKLVVSDYEVLETPQETEARMAKILETGKDSFETKHRTKTGEIRDIKNTVQVIELSGKKFFHVITQDITECKKTEDAIKESEERFRTIFEGANDGIAAVEPETMKIVFANPKLGEIMGYPPEELVNLTIADLSRAEDTPNSIEQFKKHLVGEMGLSRNVPILRGDKKIVYCDISSKLVEINDKQYLVSFFRDTTEIRKMEHELWESEERFRDLAESSGTWIWEIDADGLYTFVSPVIEKVLGYKPEEIVGKKHFYDLFPPEDLATVKNAAFQTFAKKKSFNNFLNRTMKKNGEAVWVHTYGVPLLNDEGKLLGYRGADLDVTEEIQTKEALKESEKTYRNLLNGMNDTAWVIDSDCSFIDVNDAAVKKLGYSRKELRSMKIFDIDFNLDPKKIENLVTSMPKDEVQIFQTEHTTKNGKAIPVEISSSIVTYQGKQAVLSIARDITERIKAREELRQSNERYRTVFENTGTAMCIIETDKTISMINRRFEELSGYSQKELEGKKWTEFVSKADLKRMESYHKARRRKGGKAPLHYTFDFVSKTGEIRNCMLTVNLIPETTKTVASILDITESRKAEDALREVEKNYRQTILNANVGIVVYDPNNEVSIINPQMEQMIGFKKSEILTLKEWFRKLYPKKCERDKVSEQWHRLLSENGEVKDGHAVVTTKDGRRRNFLFNAVRLESGDTIAFAVDMTERKEAEEKVEIIMNKLVSTNEKLGVVGKLTRHDARNKLSIIANNVYLAKQKLPANHNSLEFLGDAESAIDQIEDIFEFSRNYEMLGVEDLSYIEVGNSVEEATILLSGMNGVKLVNKCQGLQVLADSLLRQMFYNFIDDTMKYGEKVDRIQVYCEEKKNHLNLIYEDNGVGIPDHEKELIFKEGYGKGTGYGLYLIQKMCEEYGWTIKETGKHGKGVQFTITIPKTTKNGKPSYRFDFT